MKYQYLLPSALLQEYVDYYFVIEKDKAEQTLPVEVFPSPQAEMVFTYGDENSTFSALGAGDEQLTNDYAISGFFTKKAVYRNTNQLGVIMVGFKPWGIQPFIGFPVLEITDQNLNFKDVFPAKIRSLEDQIREVNTIEARVAVVEKFLLEVLVEPKPDALIQASVRFISESNGQVPIHALARQFYLSEKQFKRRFIRSVGIQPKLFSRIVRFQHVLKLLQARRFGMLDVAIRSGFHDDAHFIKEFESFTAQTPGEFLKTSGDSELGAYFDEQLKKSVFYNSIYR